MEEKKVQFEIETISDKETKVLCVREYDTQFAKAKEILDSHPVFEILNDDDKSQAKKLRASFNKIIDGIDRRRIDEIADYTSEFANQCNSLKAGFVERVKQLNERIKAYDEENSVVPNTSKPRVITATLKFTSLKVQDKLVKFAIDNNCDITIK